MKTWLLMAGALLLLATPVASKAQPAGRIPKIGVLGPGTAGAAVTLGPFEQSLKELGWTPGGNITIEYRYGGESASRLAELASQLVTLGADLIVARGPDAVRATRQASTSIPIVMATADDPVGHGFVQSLARPGGNITGIANRTWELDGKRPALLREALPGLTRLGVLANPTRRVYAEHAPTLLASARALQLRPQVFEVARSEEIPGAFAAIARAQVGALLVLTDILVLEPNRTRIVGLANRQRLPAMFPWRFYAELGGLMSYAASLPDLQRRAATFVDRILRGARPADLPVEEPTKFELVINMKTARALGVAIPQSVLLQADALIE